MNQKKKFQKIGTSDLFFNTDHFIMNENLTSIS